VGKIDMTLTSSKWSIRFIGVLQPNWVLAIILNYFAANFYWNKR